jgi:hypothetical protein
MEFYNDSLKTLETKLLSKLKSSQMTDSQNRDKIVEGI